MALLIDTQAIFWFGAISPRLSGAAREAMVAAEEPLLVSVVTAFEYTDLNRRGRFGPDMPLTPLLDQMGAVLVDLPAEAWRIASELPLLHLDPVDRMLIAHAIYIDATLVTADKVIRSCPVKSLW